MRETLECVLTKQHSEWFVNRETGELTRAIPLFESKADGEPIKLEYWDALIEDIWITPDLIEKGE
jgi:hypothetical protein